MLARAEGYARAEEAFKAKDIETIEEWQMGEPNRPISEEKPNKVWLHSQTPPTCKRV